MHSGHALILRISGANRVAINSDSFLRCYPLQFTLLPPPTDNALHCDCRLAWLLRLRAETASTHVQAALDSTVCHMEEGMLPARLETAAVERDPAQETSTLGIGPPVRLLDLKVGPTVLRLMELKVGIE